MKVQVVRHRTDTLQWRPDAEVLKLDLATRPEDSDIFDDWKATVCLLSFGEVAAGRRLRRPLLRISRRRRGAPPKDE